MIGAKIYDILDSSTAKKYFSMFLLRILPKFFIFVILLAMTASIYYFQNEDDFITLRNTSFILIISFTLILTVLFSFYEKPILRLELLIKKFLVGSLKTEDSNIPKTYNPHLNYIILFLGKTLNDLRSIRDEFLHGKTIKGEVELGREIQAKLLHKSLPEVPELKIVARSKPAGEIGGDSFDVIAQ